MIEQNLENPNLGISEETLPFITAAWEMVSTTLQSKGEISMMALLANRIDGSIMFVPPRGIPDKDTYARMLVMVTLAQNEEIPEDMPQIGKTMLTEMIKSMKANGAMIRPDMVLHVSEAWMVQVDLKQTTEHAIEAVAHMQREGLQSHPERIEVIVIGWKTKDGEEGHHVRKMLRDAEGKPSLGEYLMNDQMGMFTSRFLENIFTNQVVPASKQN